MTWLNETMSAWRGKGEPSRRETRSAASKVESLESRLLTGSLLTPPVEPSTGADDADDGSVAEESAPFIPSASGGVEEDDADITFVGPPTISSDEDDSSPAATATPPAAPLPEEDAPTGDIASEMDAELETMLQVGLFSEEEDGSQGDSSEFGSRLAAPDDSDLGANDGGDNSPGLDNGTSVGEDSAASSLPAGTQLTMEGGEDSAPSDNMGGRQAGPTSSDVAEAVLNGGDFISSFGDEGNRATPMQVAAAQLTAAEVTQLLARGAAASDTEDAIIAIVDRQGRILGVRVEQDVLDNFAGNLEGLVFAIDGAVAKARTAAFFANDQAPLTSRTIRTLSESTITQREVESNPNADPGDPTSTVRGPGTVAPIGLGGHFPADILHTPVVDLFDIEHTNRDSLLHPGPDLIKGTADDILLTSRFNADYDPGQEVAAPESYGFASGLFPEAQARGIATMPGGLPIYRSPLPDGDGDTIPEDVLLGGIGVFFPGPDGFATFEQNFIPGIGQTTLERYNAPKALEAEFIALAAIGGSSQAGASVGVLDGIPPVAGIDLPFPSGGRIDLVGVALQVVGPTPGIMGVNQLLDFSDNLTIGAAGSSTSGADQPVNGGGDLSIAGLPVPEGWLVSPKDSDMPGGLTAAEVEQIITQGVAQANAIRAAIRLPFGQRTKMVLAVTDTNGDVLGLFRMPDATYFSIDIAVTKARNVAYYNDAADLQPVDQLPGVEAGVAFSGRTFRFLAEPRFPSGVDNSVPPPFSILNDPGIDVNTAENLDQNAPTEFGDFQSVLGFTRFNPIANFRDPGDVGTNPAMPLAVSNINQSGVIYFPGSTSVYRNGVLLGGFGVSGDGVDQDDVTTFGGAQGFFPFFPIIRADDIIFRDTRLPFMKFNRNPLG